MNTIIVKKLASKEEAKELMCNLLMCNVKADITTDNEVKVEVIEDYRDYINFVANNISIDFITEVNKGNIDKVTEDTIREYTNNVVDLSGEDLVAIYASLSSDDRDAIDSYYSDYENIFELLLHGMSSVISDYATDKIKEEYNIED